MKFWLFIFFVVCFIFSKRSEAVPVTSSLEVADEVIIVNNSPFAQHVALINSDGKIVTYKRIGSFCTIRLNTNELVNYKIYYKNIDSPIYIHPVKKIHDLYVERYVIPYDE